jgi:hypothetical protein
MDGMESITCCSTAAGTYKLGAAIGEREREKAKRMKE